MRGKIGIAVAGTHGKTTTTSLLATVLYESGMDPTAIIGGKVDLFGGNARFGKSEYVVAEADESDSSFLYLPATYGIITNIDTDHLDHFGNIEKIDEAFLKFVGKLPFYGLAVVCLDDAGVKRSIKKWTKPILTYGLQSEADFVARDIQIDFSGTRFNVFKRKQKDNLKNNNSLNISYDSLGEFKINIYGVHNVKNALAVVALSFELGLSIENIQKGLSAFLGAKRRFEVLWKSVEKKNKILIDDYAHHPTEIMATLSTVRELWKGRIFSIFQPHRYSRFVYSRGGFLSAFYESDVVCISDIYEAGETPIEGVTSENFVKSLNETKRENQKIEYTGSLDQTFEFIQKEWKDGDLLICMGAGSITKLAHRISKELCH